MYAGIVNNHALINLSTIGLHRFISEKSLKNFTDQEVSMEVQNRCDGDVFAVYFVYFPK